MRMLPSFESSQSPRWQVINYFIVTILRCKAKRDLTIRGHNGVIAMVLFHQELHKYKMARRCGVLERGTESVINSPSTIVSGLNMPDQH